jgi:hypothetical protein
MRYRGVRVLARPDGYAIIPIEEYFNLMGWQEPKKSCQDRAEKSDGS